MLAICENSGIMTFYKTRYLTSQEQIDEEADPLLDVVDEDQPGKETASSKNKPTDEVS